METSIRFTSGRMADALGVERHHITNSLTYLGLEPVAVRGRVRLFDAAAARAVLTYLRQHQTPGLRDWAGVRAYADKAAARAAKYGERAKVYDPEECQDRIAAKEQEIAELTSDLEYLKNRLRTARSVAIVREDAERERRSADALAEIVLDS